MDPFADAPAAMTSGLLIALAGLAWAGLTLVRLAIRHRTGIPRDDPPPDMPPAVAGAVYAGTVRPEHIAATLADLAGRGGLLLEPVPGKRDWLLSPVDEHDMWPYESELVRGIFRWDDEITVRALRTRVAFRRVVRATMRGIWRHAHDLGLVAETPRSRRAPWVAAAACLVAAGLALLLPADGMGWPAAGLGVLAVTVVAAGPARSPLTASGRRAHAHLRGHRARLAALGPPEWTHEQAAYAVALGLHRELALEPEDQGDEGGMPDRDEGHRTSPATLGGSAAAASFVGGCLAVIGLTPTETGWSDSSGGAYGDFGAGDPGTDFGGDFGGGDFGGGGFDGGGGGGGGDGGGGGGGD